MTRARSASFVTSAASPAGFPAPTCQEIAFAGRSNVGKSSLINALTGVTGLARTSSTPGRTRLINWFRVAPPTGPDLCFVDLPGYGFAKVPRALRASWRPLVESLLADRPSLRLVVLIIDARRGATDDDRDLAAWLAEIGRPVLVVLTKCDKLAKSRRWPAAAAVRRELSLAREPLLFSASEALGIDELWRRVLAEV